MAFDYDYICNFVDDEESENENAFGYLEEDIHEDMRAERDMEE